MMSHTCSIGFKSGLCVGHFNCPVEGPINDADVANKLRFGIQVCIDKLSYYVR